MNVLDGFANVRCYLAEVPLPNGVDTEDNSLLSYGDQTLMNSLSLFN